MFNLSFFRVFLFAIIAICSGMVNAETAKTPPTDPAFEAKLKGLLNSGAFDDIIEKRILVISQRIAKRRAANLTAESKKSAEDQVAAVNKNIPFDYTQDHVKGPRDANISIIEYADYSCPYCSKFHLTMEKTTSMFPNINWIYRPFPIRGATSPSSKLAYAAECVSENNPALFWAFSDPIYKDQTVLNNHEGYITEFIAKNNLDAEKFNQCRDSAMIISKVSQSGINAQKAQISGTPGVIVRNNLTGKIAILPGAVDIPSIQQAMKNVF
jgi:protein-disulfide isomerase